MKSKKALIFGSNGQDGIYLNKFLKSIEICVINSSRKSENYFGDVGDFSFVKKIIKKELPDYIFHFAADSTTKHEAILDNNNSISTGTINILEAVRLFSKTSKIYITGSAMQFKNNGKPINENTPFDLSSSYSLSRIHSIYSARYYREKFNLKIYIGYLFNHDSILRSESHINQKIARTVLKIKEGSSEKLLVGNIEVRKEFNFANDIIKAIWILVNQNKIYESVIGSGISYSLKNWIND